MPRRTSREASQPRGNTRNPQVSIREQVGARLGSTAEQRLVVGPVVEHLVNKGWNLGQLIFGTREWHVPARPSEATKRERGHDFQGFPCDIAIFDSPRRASDPRHLLAVIECKAPNETAGVSQLETYLAAEPHAKLGIWLNSADESATAVFVYRMPDGTLAQHRRVVADLPRPGESVSPTHRRVVFADLVVPSADTMRRTIEELLDRVVIDDPNVTRREDQLDQLCNILLLKLHSDKLSKLSALEEPFFRARESTQRTAEEMRTRFTQLAQLYPDTFRAERDRNLRLADTSIAQCVDRLAPFKLIDIGVSTIALGFQVLRAAALKSGEGQYFTPQPVIAAGVKLMNVGLDDLIIDPACGTGGFLVEVFTQLQRRYPTQGAELSRWAQTHLYGIDKDATAVKLTKAIMQIADDGSTHCVWGDSVRTHLWGTPEYQHLQSPSFSDGRFSVVLTNPPFGQNLKVSGNDSRLSGLDIAQFAGSGNYRDLEIGLIFLQRSHQLLRVGGRLGIVLPETYFFSPQYHWVFDWLEPRMRPIHVADIPMEAFAGFCRAKTNFYIFEKIA